MGTDSRKERKKAKVCLDINRPSHGRTYPAQLEIGGSLPSRVQRGAVSVAKKQTTYAYVFWRVRRHPGIIAKGDMADHIPG